VAESSATEQHEELGVGEVESHLSERDYTSKQVVITTVDTDMTESQSSIIAQGGDTSSKF
jgi:hypothetical protein